MAVQESSTLNSKLQMMPRINKSFTLRLMDKILHDLKDSKLWEVWYIPYNG